jgi:hypothetical protein
MARLGSGGHLHHNVPALGSVDDAPVVAPQRKLTGTATYPVQTMVNLIGAMVAKLNHDIASNQAINSLRQKGSGEAATGEGEALPKAAAALPRRAAPLTLGEALQRMLLPPDLLTHAGLSADRKLSPEQCRHILAACAKALPAPMGTDPTTFNKIQPNQPDAIDHDPTIPQTYLKNIAAALTLVVGSLPANEARIIHAILESLSNKIHELDPKNLGPSVVASKPGDKMNYALGATFPPNPMTPPSGD